MAKILVVEDFEDSRFSLCRLLEMSGHSVLEALDGQQAVELATTGQPDLILMDLTLPVVDGMEATRRIRGSKGIKRMPIVAVSAHDTQNYEVEAAEAGFDACVTKPIDFDELEGLIGRLLAS